MFELTDRVAVITGAASGIGAATARRFAAAGAKVVVADIADGTEVAESIGGRYICTDVTVEAQVRDLMAAAAEITGKIDICINNAGAGYHEPLLEADVNHYRAVFELNTLGTLLGMKYAAAHMHRGGAIVSTASILGVMGYPGCGAYGASKAGIIQLTKIAALELGGRGIRVNCVCPTSVNTPQLANQPNGPSEVATFATMGGFRNLIEPDEVAAAMHFLVADDCGVISGQALILDGAASSGVSGRLIDLAETTLS